MYMNNATYDIVALQRRLADRRVVNVDVVEDRRVAEEDRRIEALFQQAVFQTFEEAAPEYVALVA